VRLEVVTMVKKLAQQQHSAALAQLASRIGAIARYGAAAGEDPFAKIKGLISDMISTLEKEAASEASHKAYCDEEMGKTKTKKEELNSDIDSLTAKIDKAAATSTKLKGQVAELQKELAAISKQQAEMDTARTDEHAAFVQAEADLKQGIEGVDKALEVLREYYGSGAAFVQSSVTSMMQQPAKPTTHSADGGAGGSIIGMLEVCVSDFSKSLAEETVAEDEAQAEYEKMTQENKISKTTKEQDVKYKTSEAKGLDKAIGEHTSDKGGLQEELTAVLDYKDKLDKQCTYAPDSYEERKKRREAEIAGLKEALKYLEGAAFTQKSSRGFRLHR
jgi:chromosome segregation ATPase